MPDPRTVPNQPLMDRTGGRGAIHSDPDFRGWMGDMQRYYHSPDVRGEMDMPDATSAAYGSIDPNSEAVRRILMALFGGDAHAVDTYQRGGDPLGKIRYPERRQTVASGNRVPNDPLLEEAKKLAEKK